MLSLNTTFDELKLSGIRRFAAMAKETPGCISLTLESRMRIRPTR
ncbi:MAG: hypothetical protein ACLT98_12370 [Eggerthellaceae bacterium]